MADPLAQTIRTQDILTPEEYVSPLLGGQSWGIRTTFEIKLQMKLLERRLQRINVTDLDMRHFYVYFDLDYDGKSDKLWIVQFLYFSKERTHATFDYFTNEWYDLKVENEGYSQLFLFEEFLFDKEFDSIFNPNNKKAAKREYAKSKKPGNDIMDKMDKLSKTKQNRKTKGKRKKRDPQTVSNSNIDVVATTESALNSKKSNNAITTKEVKQPIKIKKSIYSHGLRPSEFGVTSSTKIDCKEEANKTNKLTNPITVPLTPRIARNAPLKRIRNRNLRKRKRDENSQSLRSLHHDDDDEKEKEIQITDDIESDIKFYEAFQYYHSESGCNRYVNQQQTQRAPERMQLDYDLYETEEWWNGCSSFKFHQTRYPDPGLCPLTALSDIIDIQTVSLSSSSQSSNWSDTKLKMTRYPPPPVYDSWKKTPGSAPFPYIVRQSMSGITSSQYIERVYKYLRNRTIHVVPRRSTHESLRPKLSAVESESVSVFIC